MPFRQTSHWAFLAAVLTLSRAIAAPLAVTEPAFRQSFDGPELAWELVETGTPAKIVLHNCLAGGARDHDGIERVAVATGLGQSALLACKTPPIAALDELQARLWVKSSRPDIQVAARVVLPRSLDRQTQKPATAIVKGASYNRVGHWQELTVQDVPKLLAAEVRVLRTTPGANIDSREAYVDAVVLIVPGDPNGVELGTDQLVVEGVTLDPTRIARAAAMNANGATSKRTTNGHRANVSLAPAAPVAPASLAKSDNTPAVRMQGSMLLVDGRPFLPRAIQWNDEPLTFLAQRGFNTLMLAAPPSPEQREEAKRLGLWFISIPPRPDAIVKDGLGAEGDRVLAWNLDDAAIAADPEYAMRWAAAVRDRDRVYGRPIMGPVDSSWKAAGKVVDVLLAQHPRASCVSAVEYDAWLAARPALVKPGTPIWASINSQFGEVVHAQTKTLVRIDSPAPSVDHQQLETIIQCACTGRVRGFALQSSSSLAENDAATRNRAAGLELINRQLQLIEPWLAGGKVVSKVSSSDGKYAGVVFYVDGARLVIPLAASDESSPIKTKNRSSEHETTFLIPGVPEASQAYFVTPVSMGALATDRVAGGTRLKVPAPDAGLVVITEDPLIVRALRQRIDRQAAATLRLERDMLVAASQALMETDRRLAQVRGKPNPTSVDAASINARLAQLDSLIGANQAEPAQLLLANLQADVNRFMRDERRLTGLDSGLENNAFGLQFAHLADSLALQQSFANLRSGENLLTGGDFESLEELTQAGWKHKVPTNAEATTHVQLTTTQPQHGDYCLELQATAPADGHLADIAEPRVWIVSPVVPIDAAGKVEISGWVKVDQPFATPAEGLTIIDSLGGPELSVIVGKTAGWQLFRMIRAVSEPVSLQITFALTGTGAAQIDAVMVRTLQQPIARRLPPVNAQTQPKAATNEDLPGPVLELPQTR